MKQNIIYVSLTTIIVAAIAVVFNFFPRSHVSELEKRELQTFPQFSVNSLLDGSFTASVSSWYSDSEPYRDNLMTVSMLLGEYQGVKFGGDEHVTFHASTDDMGDIEPIDPEQVDIDTDSNDFNPLTIDENTKIANAGIIIVGTGPNVRALMCYGGTGGGDAYANAANTYKSTFGSAVNVYSMVIPTAVSFYCPEKVKNRSRSELSTIQSVASKLQGGVKPVIIYNILAEHASEDIYLRTDHHWAPLGAYYAAKEFARVAGVPFKDISEYDRHVVHGYVGSMYGYSGDISVKNAPEDFVYWTPRGVTYNTTYITYTLDKQYKIVGESKPHSGQFFIHFKDGSGGAYCTFMGSDCKITNVKTSTRNGRRLLILKDSFGNAIPGWLFGSFEEVNVVDCRYFTKNMVQFVEENRITDILFANNTFKAYSPYVGRTYVRFLSQKGGIPPRPKPDTDSSATSPTSTTPTTTPQSTPTTPSQPSETPTVQPAATQPDPTDNTSTPVKPSTE